MLANATKDTTLGMSVAKAEKCHVPILKISAAPIRVNLSLIVILDAEIVTAMLPFVILENKVIA